MFERRKTKKQFDLLLEAYINENFKSVEKIEYDFIKIIKKYPRLNEEKKKFILELINQLLEIKIEVIFYIQDMNLNSYLLDYFNEFFKQKRLKNNKGLILDIVGKLLIVDLNAKKLKSFNNLLEIYYNEFNLKQKTDVLLNIINNNSATLDISFIEKLKDDVQNKHFIFPDDLDLITNIAIISRKTKIDLDMDKVYNDSFSYANSQESLKEKVIYFIIEMNNHVKYVSDVEKWLMKYEKTETNRILNERRLEIIRLKNQRKGIVNKKEIVYYNRPKDYKATYYDIVTMQRDLSFSKEETFKKATNVIDRWREELANYEDINEKILHLAYYYKLKSLMRYLRYWSNFNKELNKVEYYPDVSKEIIMFVNDHSLVNASIALPLLIEAKKQGYFICGTSPLDIDHFLTNDEELNQITNRMIQDIDTIKYKDDLMDFDYSIDIKNKEILVEGFNVYQPIYEFVSRYQFTYFFNYETDAWVRAKVHTLIFYFKRVFDYCDEIYDYCLKNDKKFRFISNAPHFHHAASYRIYCEEKGYKANMEFICLSPGYDNYFKNVGDATTETLSVLNMNQNPNSRNSFLGTASGFEAFYQRNISSINAYRSEAQDWLSANRSVSGVKNNKEKEEILNRIKRYKDNNKKVILVNGKVVFDLCVKYTKGIVHEDMSDWLTHTVEVAQNNPNILLIIKPHPHEQRKDLTMTDEPIVSLKDLIKTDMNYDNIIYLKPETFKNEELLPYVDLGIVWNGTSSLEFLSQNIKTLAMDQWALFDYPIGLCNLENRKKYEEVLVNPDKLELPNDISDKAIAFLHYMGSEDVRVPNKYTQTSTLNYHQFTNSKIFSDKIDDLIKNGDHYMEDLVKKIVE